MCSDVLQPVRESFTRSPQKSTVKCGRELDIPQPTVCKIGLKRIQFKLYKLQILQVRANLNNQLPEKYIVRTGSNDKVLLNWAQRYPDITLCDSFYYGDASKIMCIQPHYL